MGYEKCLGASQLGEDWRKVVLIVLSTATHLKTNIFLLPTRSHQNLPRHHQSHPSYAYYNRSSLQSGTNTSH
jgi:hypothetical protein